MSEAIETAPVSPPASVPDQRRRVFVTEIAIVFIGVVIALGAQQLVETLHWRSEVSDARAALKTELERNLGAVDYRLARGKCVQQRLDELESWLASWRAGKPRQIRSVLDTPTNYSNRSSVWEIVKTGQTAARMPLDDKIAYARLYDLFANINLIRQIEDDSWRELKQYEGARTLDEPQLMRLQAIIGNLRNRDAVAAANKAEMRAIVERLGLRAEVLKTYDAARDRRFCQSIFAKTKD